MQSTCMNYLLNDVMATAVHDVVTTATRRVIVATATLKCMLLLVIGLFGFVLARESKTTICVNETVRKDAGARHDVGICYETLAKVV